MDETTEKCPICLEDFNTDDLDKTPHEICEHGHFICKGCIKPFIESHYTNRSNVSITTNISDSAIKLVCQYDGIGENSLPPCIKCPMCRNPIKYDFKKLRRNNQSWGVENTFIFYKQESSWRLLEKILKKENIRLIDKLKSYDICKGRQSSVVISNPPYSSGIQSMGRPTGIN